MSAKPWQIAVIVLGVAGLGVSLLFQMRKSASGVKLAEAIYAADLSTGELFEAPIPSGRGMTWPAANPSTKELVVYPVVQRDGRWVVIERYRPAGDELAALKGKMGATNPNSFEVTPRTPQPSRVKLW